MVDLREEGQVVIDVGDGDGDHDRRRQRRVAFVRRLHRQRVVRRLWNRTTSKQHEFPLILWGHLWKLLQIQGRRG